MQKDIYFQYIGHTSKSYVHSCKPAGVAAGGRQFFDSEPYENGVGGIAGCFGFGDRLERVCVNEGMLVRDLFRSSSPGRFFHTKPKPGFYDSSVGGSLCLMNIIDWVCYVFMPRYSCLTLMRRDMW